MWVEGLGLGVWAHMLFSQNLQMTVLKPFGGISGCICAAEYRQGSGFEKGFSVGIWAVRARKGLKGMHLLCATHTLAAVGVLGG